MAELLGKRRFQPDVARRTGEPGVATGLAWTPVGGDVLFVEATSFPGEGKLQVTGQLGDVMKESAQAALSYVKRNVRASWATTCPRTGSARTTCTCTCPPARSPRTARAPGITMATALSSLVSGRPVRSDTAMTGEITLTGKVLPIGGLKEKALAAQRAEITRVIAPRRNEPDADEFPPNLLKGMELVLVDTVDEVLEAALEPERDRRQGAEPAPASTRGGSGIAPAERRRDPRCGGCCAAALRVRRSRRAASRRCSRPAPATPAGSPTCSPSARAANTGALDLVRNQVDGSIPPSFQNQRAPLHRPRPARARRQREQPGPLLQAGRLRRGSRRG